MTEFHVEQKIIPTLVVSQQSKVLSDNNHTNLMTLFIFLGVMATICIGVRLWNRHKKTLVIQDEPQASAYMYKTLMSIIFSDEVAILQAKVTTEFLYDTTLPFCCIH